MPALEKVRARCSMCPRASSNGQVRALCPASSNCTPLEHLVPECCMPPERWRKRRRGRLRRIAMGGVWKMSFLSLSCVMVVDCEQCQIASEICESCAFVKHAPILNRGESHVKADNSLKSSFPSRRHFVRFASAKPGAICPFCVRQVSDKGDRHAQSRSPRPKRTTRCPQGQVGTPHRSQTTRCPHGGVGHLRVGTDKSGMSPFSLPAGRTKRTYPPSSLM
jgi:hypothetical protein